MKQSTWLFIAIAVLFILTLGCDRNTGPYIDAFIVPDRAGYGSRVEFKMLAHDIDGDALTYIWQVDDSVLDDTTSTVAWDAPESGGEGSVEVRVSVLVSDGGNEAVMHWKYLEIVPAELTPLIINN